MSLGSILNRLLHTKLGHGTTSMFVAATQYRVFSPRTLHAMRFDLMRLGARRRWSASMAPASDRLHVGCGSRIVAGWVNTDVAGSDVDLDLSRAQLPWPDDSFNVIVSQHFIEHLGLHEELIPLLKEFRRVLRPDGEIWLTCPDMEKLCRAYLDDRAERLLEYTLGRTAGTLDMRGAPSQHYVNLVFDQTGEHRNLFDYGLLAWALRQAGFQSIDRVREQDLLGKFPEFPARHDDLHSLYVRACG